MSTKKAGDKFSKHWGITSKEGKRWNWTPQFEVVPESEKEGVSEVECRYITIEIDGVKHTFDYLNIYMFMYFCANEELRQGLNMRYHRQVTKVPYDVSFKLDSSEMKSGTATRRIVLEVDELTMAVARAEAMKMIAHKVKTGESIDPREFIYKGKRK